MGCVTVFAGRPPAATKPSTVGGSTCETGAMTPESLVQKSTEVFDTQRRIEQTCTLGWVSATKIHESISCRMFKRVPTSTQT